MAERKRERKGKFNENFCVALAVAAAATVLLLHEADMNVVLLAHLCELVSVSGWLVHSLAVWLVG